MKLRICVAAALLAACAPQLFAQDKPCSKADAANAEKAIDRASSWPQLSKAYKDFRHCDSNAAVADVYAETIVRLIVDWKNVDALVAEMQSEPFKAFVHAHLKRPIAKDDLETIYSRAKASCPAKHDAFCADLAAFVKAAGAL